MKNASLWTCSLLLAALFDLMTDSVAQTPRSGVRSLTAAKADSGMRFIPAGSYIRGDVAETRHHFRKDHTREIGSGVAHPVRLTKPFYISKTEVTVRQFREFVDATEYITSAEKDGTQAVGFEPKDNLYHGIRNRQPFNRHEKFNWENPGFEQTDSHPVVCVSWKDTQEYCRWLSAKERRSYRLPTEAEWEYACRSGSQEAFHWGREYVGVIHQKANIGNVELERAHEDFGIRKWFIDPENGPEDGYVYTSPVGNYPANDFGLHDMHGNVWEWCHDTYLDTCYEQFRSPGHPRPAKTAVDPVNEAPWNEFGDWRVIRGGSWYVAPGYARSDVRGRFDAPDAACYLGFRVVHEASPEQIAKAKAEWGLKAAAIARVKSVTNGFEAEGAASVFRRVDLRDTATPQVTRDLPLIPRLTHVGMRSTTAESLPHFAAMPDLRSLTIWQAQDLTDEDLAALAECTKLEHLTIGTPSKLTNACIQHLTGLTKLRFLNLAGEGINDTGLVQFQRLGNLRSLELSVNTQGAILSSLGEIPLRRLRLPDLNDEHATKLIGLKELRAVQCTAPSLTDEGFAAFSGLGQLTELDLRNTRISPDGFGPLGSMPRLESLTVHESQISDAAMKLISNHQWLKRVNIGGDHLTDAGIHHLCNVISLDTITVSGSQLTDEAFRDFWRLQRLHGLRFHSPKVTGAGFGPLAEARNLHRIWLTSDSLTNAAFVHISKLAHLTYLEVNTGLSESTELNDEGLLLLADCEKLNHLVLQVSEDCISNEAIEELKARKAGLRVEVRR